MSPAWRPTPALIRAGLASLTLAGIGVVAGRPDLLVLAAPLLVLAAGGLLHRPVRVPGTDSRLLHASLREGEGTLVRCAVTDAEDVEHAVVALTRHQHLAYQPPYGVRGVTAGPGAAAVTVDIPVSPLRWGRRAAGDGLVAATSGWAGFRSGPVELRPHTLTTLPMPGLFDTTAPTPHPIGLVGTNPARRTGDGTDFASIRPFTPGDRLLVAEGVALDGTKYRDW